MITLKTLIVNNSISDYEIVGDEFVTISGVAALDQAKKGDMSFCKMAGIPATELLSATNASVVLCNNDVTLPSRTDVTFVKVGNPRLCFALLCGDLIDGDKQKKPSIHSTVIIGSDCSLANVNIGPYVVLGNNVSIAGGTVIESNVVIGDNVTIGHDCYIKSNTTIGEKGFGFERDNNDVPIAIPHIGKVKIGNRVELGANNTVVRGTFSSTVVGDDVKTDDHVHIAHNVVIGDRTLIAACAEISGSVKIGKNCWLGPNCSIMNGIKIGDNSLVGLGAVVLKTIPDNVVVVGNPAKILRSVNVEVKNAL